MQTDPPIYGGHPLEEYFINRSISDPLSLFSSLKNTVDRKYKMNSNVGSLWPKATALPWSSLDKEESLAC